MEGETAIDSELFPKLSVKQSCLQPNHQLKSCLGHRCRGKGAIVLKALPELPFQQAYLPPLSQLPPKQSYLPPNDQLESFQLQHLCWCPSSSSSSDRRGLLPAPFVFNNQTILAFRSHQSVSSALLASCIKVACVAHFDNLRPQPHDRNLTAKTSQPHNSSLAITTSQPARIKLISEYLPGYGLYIRTYTCRHPTSAFSFNLSSSLPHSICANMTAQSLPERVHRHLHS